MKEEIVKKTTALILLIFQIGFGAVTVQVNNFEAAGDNQWLRPTIKITNTGSTAIDLSQIKIDYYIYEENITASQIEMQVWSFSKNVNTLWGSAEISKTVTQLNPAYVSGTQKANFKIQLYCTASNRTLSAGEFMELSVGFHVNDYRNMNKTDDWSYNGETSYQNNPNIVISNAGTVICGNAPGNGTTPPPSTKITMKWTGSFPNAPTPEDGDVYFNNTDKKAYVYSNQTWNILSNGIWQTEANNSISYKTGTVNTSKLVSDRVEVKEVVVTPKWQIDNTPPDYVFEKGYNLPSINDVESFIRKNGHLSEMPSAADFKERGVNLAEMNMKLLKKVEELTLYTIQLNKDLRSIRDSLSIFNNEPKEIQK